MHFSAVFSDDLSNEPTSANQSRSRSSSNTGAGSMAFDVGTGRARASGSRRAARSMAPTTQQCLIWK